MNISKWNHFLSFLFCHTLKPGSASFVLHPFVPPSVIFIYAPFLAGLWLLSFQQWKRGQTKAAPSAAETTGCVVFKDLASNVKLHSYANMYVLKTPLWMMGNAQHLQQRALKLFIQGSEVLNHV